MYYTVGDQLRVTNSKPLDDRHVEWMRGIAWLIHALQVSGATPTEFAEAYVHRGRSDSGLMRKWLSGKSHPVRHSALQVEKLLPRTLWVFDLDIWGLLKNVPISNSAVERIIGLYSRESYWRFPEDTGPRSSERSVLAEINDTQRLVYRGDFWGFFGALATARFYETTADDISYKSALMDTFRALPGALKEPWLRPLGEHLMDQLLTLKSRRFSVSLMFGVDERIIFRQADDPGFEPHRDWRGMDPATRNATELEDPIVLSDLTPNPGVRDRRATSPLAGLGGKVG